MNKLNQIKRWKYIKKKKIKLRLLKNEKFIILKDSSNAFISNHKDNYESIKCLYLGQREYATVKLNDPFIDVIGSDAATTCHLTLIVDSSTYINI